MRLSSVESDGHARIDATRGATPKIFITRFRLYASTCKLISVLTRGNVLVRKCVAPIHALRVPKGCSTVCRRIRDARGVRFNRLCIASITSSCSHLLIRRYSPVVHWDLSGHRGQADVQYLCMINPSSTLLQRQMARSPAGQRYSSFEGTYRKSALSNSPAALLPEVCGLGTRVLIPDRSQSRISSPL